MNWKDYEKEIHDSFKSMYPSADISYNVKVTGRYSKVERQIDVLIEDYVAGNRIRIVVDGKFFSKKINVKDVEMFIGMLLDCEANKGLLITDKGYSQAAINRAYYDPIDIELDILNFKDLLKFQGFVGFPYIDDYGVVLPAPFGWIVDVTRRPDKLATLYQRGLTLDQAKENKEWMYVNLWKKDNKIKTLDDLLEFQATYTLHDYPDAKIEYLPTVKREDANIKLRVIEISTYPTNEYTGFVEFEEFLFICVLFTPDELKKKNIRKLESILLKVLPLHVNQTSGQ